MRKIVILLLFVLPLVGLAACSQKKEDTVPDMQDRFEALQKLDQAPEMLVVPPEKCNALYGIVREDCTQQVVAICTNSLLADEYWLIEATDSAAADRIEALAQTHLELKAAELESYLPAQYEVIKQAQLFRRGNCVILLVSPQAEALASAFF